MMHSISRVRLLLLIAADVAALIGVSTVSSQSALASPTSCVTVSPSSSLSLAVAAAPPGTAFCLVPGTYPLTQPVVVEAGDTFTGIGNSRPVIDASHVVDGFISAGHETTGLVYSNLVINGAVSSGGKDTTGRAISGGARVVVTNVSFANNGQVAIGGQDGLTVTNSTFTNNGGFAPHGCCNGAIKEAHAFTVTGSTFTNNNGSAVWCDVGCSGGTMIVEGNIFTGPRQGVRYEISTSPAWIDHNTFTSTDPSNVAVQIANSSNASVDSNSFTGPSRFVVDVTGFGPARRLKPTSDTITNNSLHHGLLSGCGSPGVMCSGNF